MYLGLATFTCLKTNLKDYGFCLDDAKNHCSGMKNIPRFWNAGFADCHTPSTLSWKIAFSGKPPILCFFRISSSGGLGTGHVMKGSDM